MQKHPFDDLKFLIELDRRGDNDSVYYECANDEFEQFINPFGFETAYGTLSDISALAPMWGIAAVNFSIGYRDEHSHEERLYVNSMFATIEKVKDILEYIYEFRGEVEYVVFTYSDQCEVVSISEIPNYKKCLTNNMHFGVGNHTEINLQVVLDVN